MKNYEPALDGIEQVREELWKALRECKDQEVYNHIWNAMTALFIPQKILEEWKDEQDIEMAEIAKSFDTCRNCKQEMTANCNNGNCFDPSGEGE
jgi:hypothetical protein